MTGQDGGFREAAARFSADVDSALTRARRAASEAKAQAGEFRRGTAELAEQAKTGQLRGVRRDQVEPTAGEPRAEAEKFRDANGLGVAEFPDADTLISRLPAEEPKPAAPVTEDDDEDFSQHQIMTGDETDPKKTEIASPEPENARSSDDDEDFSQQRILVDATSETYRPVPMDTGLIDVPDPQSPS